MKNLFGHVRSAIDQYQMIDEGDHIAVALSGGKDSVFLLMALHKLADYYPKKFKLSAITVDPCFDNKHTDFSLMEELCESLSIPYIIKRTEIASVVFKDKEPSSIKGPCSLCARIRRGILHNACVEIGCNKIALGHHMDDAVQTFFMNLLYGGKISCFSPSSYLSRKEITSIRPLLFCKEKNIISQVKKLELPVVISGCPVDGKTARKDTDDLIKSLKKIHDFKDLDQKVIGAMQRMHLDQW